ncbi:hypothetical protein J6590_043522 [Homalodisca vitripennis]|nr:hypothetical protein J6590_043522 [Homalodisca vitripennis]
MNNRLTTVVFLWQNSPNMLPHYIQLAGKYPCGVCTIGVKYKGILCTGQCNKWFHSKCLSWTDKKFKNLTTTEVECWECDKCTTLPEENTDEVKAKIQNMNESEENDLQNSLSLAAEVGNALLAENQELRHNIMTLTIKNSKLTSKIEELMTSETHNHDLDPPYRDPGSLFLTQLIGIKTRQAYMEDSVRTIQEQFITFTNAVNQNEPISTDKSTLNRPVQNPPKNHRGLGVTKSYLSVSLQAQKYREECEETPNQPQLTKEKEQQNTFKITIFPPITAVKLDPLDSFEPFFEKNIEQYRKETVSRKMSPAGTGLNETRALQNYQSLNNTLCITEAQENHSESSYKYKTISSKVNNQCSPHNFLGTTQKIKTKLKTKIYNRQ